jgi:hypothetical protein
LQDSGTAMAIPQIGSFKLGTRALWSRQLRQWHWISSAVCLVLMLLFAVTGVTLNHADLFESPSEPVVREVAVPGALHERLARLGPQAVVPEALAAEIRRLTGADVTARRADNQYGEIVFDLAAPGRDRVLTIDLNAGSMTYEVTDRGWVALFNDLHKGRHSGDAWKLLIDLAAAFFVVFTLTGFGLLWLHARTRVSTWPLTALGLVVPVVIFLLLVH